MVVLNIATLLTFLTVIQLDRMPLMAQIGYYSKNNFMNY